MGTIAQEIARIQQAKADLKAAIEAKGVTVPTSAKLDDYPDLVEQISGGGYAFDLAGIKLGTKTTITKEDGEYIASFINVSKATNLFNGQYVAANTSVKLLKSADYSSIDSIKLSYGADGLHSQNTSLESFNFNNLTLIRGNYTARSIFDHTNIIVASFPSLETIDGTQAFGYAFSNCSNLTTINFPALKTIKGTNVLIGAFSSCPNIATATVHPNALSSSLKNYNILGEVNSTVFTTLRLSSEATSDVYLSWAAHLDSASILDVLNHLSTSATGKTCAFANLTVDSSDENHSAISAKVAALTNWTITGLTL